MTTVADTVFLALKCQSKGCGKTFQEPLTRLIPASVVPCPYCGVPLDVQSRNNRFRIQRLAEECARMDAALREAGQGR